MKKLLLGAFAFLFAFQSEAGTVPTCRCAGQCTGGRVCNCATNSCMARPNSRYAYGYIDTADYSQNYAYAAGGYAASPVYQQSSAVAPYNYGSQPSRKYSTSRTRPYFAGRFLLSKALADFKHTQYVEGHNRATYSADVDDVVYGGALAFGVNVDNFRFELEGSLHTKAKADYEHAPMVSGYYQDKMEHKIQTMALLFNAYYDFYNSSKLTPYLGAGLGVGHIRSKIKSIDPDTYSHLVDIDTHSENKTNFIWQIGAGLSYALDERANLEVGYRFTNYGKMEVMDWRGEVAGGNCGRDKLELKDYRTHTLTLGVRVDI